MGWNAVFLTQSIIYLLFPLEIKINNKKIIVTPPLTNGFACQVINAALTLAARPQSKVAQDNMDVFKDQWEKQVRVLTEAVDDITSVDDFLSVSGTGLKRLS